MRRFVLFILSAMLCIASAWAQVSVVASAPSASNVGGTFRLSFKVNNSSIESVGELSVPDGLEVLYGPSRSTSSSISVVNGKTTQESSTMLTYTLSASKAGSYTLPTLTVKVGGKDYTSNAASINIVEGDLPGQQSNSGGRTNRSSVSKTGEAASNRTSGKDLFITVTANKREVWEQEPVLLSYKVYTKLNLTQLSGKMPDLKGFMSKEVELPQEKNFGVESFGGENYYSTEWSKYVMFPQQTGKLSIPEIKFEGIVVYQDAFDDIFDAFFSGRRAGVQKKRTIVAPGLDITVKPLPAGKPESFSGGVGQFKITSKLLTQQPRTGESIDLEVKISGVGNLDLIMAPNVEFPDGFDTYEPRQNVSSKLTTAGMQGAMTINYVAIPQSKGRYVIPAIEFSYFDPSSGSYKTLHTEPITVDVAQGSKSSYSGKQQEIDAQSDIRYLKKWNFRQQSSSGFFGSTLHMCLYICVIVLALIVALVVSRLGKPRAGGSVGKDKKCLQRARRSLREGKTDEFYEELLQGLRLYLSTKLGVAPQDLSDTRISEHLADRDPELCERTLSLLSQCELHRYGATQTDETPSETMKKATSLLSDLDIVLRKRKKGGKVGVVILALVFNVQLVLAGGATLQQADSLYDAGRYEEAISCYEELTATTEHPFLYYNLGNAYYRNGNIAKAILNYERAQLLNPADGDIAYNLALARTKTIDKVETQSTLGEWLRSLALLQSVDAWALWGFVAFVICLAGLLVYLLCTRIGLRKAGFGVAILGLLFALLLNFLAYSSHLNLINSSSGIVMQQSTVRSTPSSSGNALFTLHEGTKVRITDSQMNDYLRIELTDGKVGWIERKRVETI